MTKLLKNLMWFSDSHGSQDGQTLAEDAVILTFLTVLSAVVLTVAAFAAAGQISIG